MVEYFGQQLGGFCFTQNGWVQSYGSRCVKPPVIYGDVYRKQPMTIDWIRYAQSLTQKPVKGMNIAFLLHFVQSGRILINDKLSVILFVLIVS